VTISSGNLFADIPDRLPEEQFLPLLAAADVRVERIVSRGHASPQGYWYDQPQGEWVVVLAGTAGVQFEGETAARTLRRGDYLYIPGHVRHRVAWTDANEPTVWLAVHHGAAAAGELVGSHPAKP
jgi:cupin 2 domain-containing protein